MLLRRLLRRTAALASLALAVTSLPSVVARADAAPDADAKPALQGVFTTPDEPQQLVAGPDGNMWVSMPASATELVRITPAGVRTYYDVVPNGLGALTVAGGNLWSTTINGLVRIPPGNPAAATVTPNADIPDPRGIALGPDGFLWAASGDRVIRFSPADPASAVATTVAGMGAREVAATRTHVWVVDNSGGRLLAFEPDASGSFVTKNVGGSPQGITAGPDGQVLYTNPGTTPQTVGRLTATTNPALTAVPDADPSFSVAYGADGAYWIGLFNERRMLRLTPRGAATRLFTFAAPYRPRHVARGPGGIIWVSLQDPGNDGAVARITGVRDDVVGLALPGKRVKVEQRRARVRLACPAAELNGPCRGTASLRVAGRTVGKRAYAVAPGKAVVVQVRLKRRVVRSIPRGGKRAQLVVVVRDGAGNARTAKRSVRLRR